MKALSLLFLLALQSSCSDDRSKAEDKQLPTVANHISNHDQFPQHLSNFKSFEQDSNERLLPEKTISGGLSYAPKHPLWTNGLNKFRTLFMPEGQFISWRGTQFHYPVGTLLFKTFFDSPEHPIETRVMMGSADGWRFATYIWQEDRKDAKLMTSTEAVDVALTTSPGVHRIPPSARCPLCHVESSGLVLGLVPQQLDSATIHEMEQRSLLKRVDPVSENWMDPIDSKFSGTEQKVMGYFQGNCVHCHNGVTFFSLKSEDAKSNLIGVKSSLSRPDMMRVKPGCTEKSVLSFALSRTSNSGFSVAPMPPIGVQIRDEDAVKLVDSWIKEMPGNCEQE